MYERSRNLFDCHIAGFAYYDGLNVINDLKPGVSVELDAEPDNPHDPYAVAIYFDGAKLGYIPQAKNNYISNLIYFGYGGILESKINCHHPDAYPERQFRVVIKLRDGRTG